MREEAQRPVAASGASALPSGGAGLTMALYYFGASTSGALPAAFGPATDIGYPMSSWERVPLLGTLFGDGASSTTTSPVVVEGIQGLDRLATVRWTESVVVTKENESPLGRLLTEEKIVLVAVGEVEAGLDLATLGPDDIEIDGERVTIRLPEPEILSSSLDEERTSVVDLDQGLLRLGSDDAVAMTEEARRDAEADITSTAQENGILETAESNAEESIRAFVLSLGFEEVKFAG